MLLQPYLDNEMIAWWWLVSTSVWYLSSLTVMSWLQRKLPATAIACSASQRNCPKIGAATKIVYKLVCAPNLSKIFLLYTQLYLKKNILPAWLCRLLSALRWVITLSRAVLHHHDQNSKVYSFANDRIIKLINFNPRKFSIVRHAYFRWSNSLLWIKSLVHLGVNKLVSIIHCVDSFTGESIGHALRSHRFQHYRQNSVILVIQKCEHHLSGEMSCHILVNLPVVQLVSSKSYEKNMWNNQGFCHCKGAVY